MKTLCIAIQKGGQGKSMLCTHMAFAAAERGLKVLAIDLDGQGNFSKNIFAGYEPKDGELVMDVFLDTRPTPLVIDLPGVAGSIALLGGEKRLTSVDETPEVPEVALQQALQHYAKDFDLCIIDPPPTLGKRLRIALLATDFVLMPFVPARESIDGLSDLLDTITYIKESGNQSMSIIGLLANKVNSRSAADKKMIADVQATGMLIPHTIHERTSITGAMADSQPVWAGRGGESQRLAAKEVRAACDYVLKQILG